ncbi:enoyl-CoA hydratase/isomerase family protein [Bacillus taeanensis]|uniref:Enoyl-CoA hydratase/isomerase family protein n=1 Tax=Bacillus taeanensis TaxID=273032 RepID=A0A366Y1N9_9BACI|nr:enoyl-CoA hydratase/isomerase family protein [Bacillus taeanensis]RBW70111.1 enoyl-CoA hydratase/isomerase family protein [Bacillus taeanensis]
MKQYETISFYVENSTAVLTFNRPPVNVLNMEMMEEIVDALETVCKNNSLTALVIKAEGKAFSAGVAIEDHLGDKTEPMIHLFHKMFHILARVQCPTIAVVDGAALGGGCEVATFCDIVIATEKAKFGQPEINLGLFPPVSVVSFPWLMGLNRTMELLLTGETIDAQKAYEYGLVNRIVAREELDSSIEKLLSNFRSKSPLALSLMKKAIRKSMTSSFSSAIGEVEQIYLQDLVRTNDAQEGLHSFLEKREPVWKNS